MDDAPPFNTEGSPTLGGEDEGVEDLLGGRESLGPYELLEGIGRGGMGVVYKAFHPELKRTVALKVLIAGEDASDEAITRFHREAEAVARLGHHPNIVPVYDIGQTGRLHYFAMHYVTGQSLDKVIDGGTLDPRGAAEVTLKLAGALQHAHENGIVHRDIKPANVIMATPEGEGADGAPEGGSGGNGEGENGPAAPPIGPSSPGTDGTTASPMLTDFGLAKDVAAESSMTRSGMTLGTPQYMPPEQADGRVSDVDERSDIYSLGATLYEMLTLLPPFTGETPISVIRQVVTEDPVPPSKLNGDVDKDLETICLKSLAKEPARRYQTGREFAEDLGRYLGGSPIEARPVSVWEKIAKKMRRHRGVSITAVAALILLLAGAVVALAVVLGSERKAEKAQKKAEQETEKKEEARSLLQKNQAASKVLLGAFGKLGRIQSEFKALLYDDSKAPEEKKVIFQSRAGDIEDFFEKVDSDPASRATALAVRGWLTWLAGDRPGARKFFASARAADPDVGWAPFLEAMGWLGTYITQRPPHHHTASILGFRLSPQAPETDEMKAVRLKYEALLEEARKAKVWGGESPAEWVNLVETFREMVGGDQSKAADDLRKALSMWSMAWLEEELHLARAEVLYRARKFDESITAFEAYLDRCPGHLNAIDFLGIVHTAVACVDAGRGKDPKESFSKAIEVFTGGLEKAPAYTRLRLSRGRARYLLAEWERNWGTESLELFQAVIEDMAEALEKNPNNTDALVILGNAHWRAGVAEAARGGDPTGSFDQALKAYERGLATTPGSAALTVSLGKIFISLGERSGRRGGDPRPLYRKAVENFERVLEADSGHLGALNGLGWVHQRLGEAEDGRGGDPRPHYESARECNRRIIDIAPEDKQALNNLGSALRSLGDVEAWRGKDPRTRYGEAIAAFENALEVNPTHGDAAVNLSSAYMALGNWQGRRGIDPRPVLDKGVAVIEKILEMKEDFFEGQYVLGKLCQELAQAHGRRGGDARPHYMRAIEAHARAIEQSPGMVKARVGLGAARLNFGEMEARRGADPRRAYELAVADFREALKGNPGHEEARLYLGMAYYNLGSGLLSRNLDPREMMRKASEAYSEVLSRNPEKTTAYNNRGNALDALATAEGARGGDPRELYERAITDFREALKRNPNFVAAHLNLGTTLSHLGEAAAAWTGDTEPHYSQALEAYGRAAKLNKALWQIPTNQGVLLHKMGRFEEAAEALEGAIALVGEGVPMLKTKLGAVREVLSRPPWRRKVQRADWAFSIGAYALAGGLYAEAAAGSPDAPETMGPAETKDLLRTHYNLARIRAAASTGRKGRKASRADVAPEAAASLRDGAVGALKRAMKLGLSDLAVIEAEPEFEPLRELPAFEELLGKGK
jgi:serine/threonine protein kinase/Flp pilus assembly protein TadD